MNVRAGQLRQSVGADGAGYLFMGSHSPAIQNELTQGKCLLHNSSRYINRMTDPAERLRIARLRAGYQTATEAAEALGFPVSTYLAHENGTRGYPAKKAYTYARRFKVREQWLLYGVGPGPGESDAPKAEVVDIFDRLPALQQAEALGYLRGLAKVNGNGDR